MFEIPKIPKIVKEQEQPLPDDVFLSVQETESGVRFRLFSKTDKGIWRAERTISWSFLSDYEQERFAIRFLVKQTIMILEHKYREQFCK